MGRPKAALLRQLANAHGWLVAERPLPDDSELAAVLPTPGTSKQCVSSLQDHREQIQAWVHSGVQGTTIHAALVRKHGFGGSYSAVRRMLQSIRADEPVAATMILDFDPGEAAQVDFGAGPLITDAFSGETFKTWVFVMTLCFSRHQYAELVRDQTVTTWLSCHRHAFEWFNGVVARVIIDNPKCAITRACVHDPKCSVPTPSAPRDTASKSILAPHEIQQKGNRRVGGQIHQTSLPAAARVSLARRRQRAVAALGHGGGGQPRAWQHAPDATDALRTDREAPAQAAAGRGAGSGRVGQAHRASRFARAVGQVPAGAATVRIFHEHQLVAMHPRPLRPGQRSTLDDHLPPDALAWSLAHP